MTALPNPLAIWSLALAALALGLRDRRRHRPSRSPRDVPLAIRCLATLPVPRAVVTKGQGAGLAADLASAGLTAPGIAIQFARARLGGAMAGLALGGALSLADPVGAILGAGVATAGWIAPRRWAAIVARRRRRRAARELPDLIDLVVICTEAGMALDSSLRLAAERLPGPLPEEVAAVMRALDLGTARRDAYRSLATRMGISELTGLVAALLQAEELGTPIAGVLRRQAALLRSARRQDVREHAARAAPKVQLVVAMVMVPAALIVVLGVLVIQLAAQIGTFGGTT